MSIDPLAASAEAVMLQCVSDLQNMLKRKLLGSMIFYTSVLMFSIFQSKTKSPCCCHDVVSKKA